MKLLVFVFVYLFVAVRSSHTYLDPGTGSYILQVVAGTLLAGGYFFKDSLSKVFRKISSVFKKVTKK